MIHRHIWNNLMHFITTALNIAWLVYYRIRWGKFRECNNFAHNCTPLEGEKCQFLWECLWNVTTSLSIVWIVFPLNIVLFWSDSITNFCLWEYLVIFKSITYFQIVGWYMGVDLYTPHFLGRGGWSMLSSPPLFLYKSSSKWVI